MQTRREGLCVPWRDGAAARAYREHEIHVRDLRDVPVQGLVEAGGVLPGAERGRRGLLRGAWGAEAAGCTPGGRLACGGAMGQQPARAYIEHVFHVRDLRDVPVQGLVEISGVLPGAERRRRLMLRRAWAAEAAC